MKIVSLAMLYARVQPDGPCRFQLQHDYEIVGRHDDGRWHGFLRSVRNLRPARRPNASPLHSAARGRCWQDGRPECAARLS
jgi:hypothetical protein